MSISSVSREISRFLADDVPEVISLHGNWGVGKTFLWHRVLHDVARKGDLALPTYAYVSLFGRDSLQDVRSCIFENIRDVLGNEENREDGIVQRIKNLGREAKKYRSILNHLSPATVPISERLMFSSVRKCIVCFDDLERSGSGLSVKDVLGLAVQLKEERDCKVVFLLNKEKIEQGHEDFLLNMEKVVDVSMKLAPLACEAAQLGLSKECCYRDEVVSNCVTLGITNIRTIKRVERKVRRIVEVLDGFDSRVVLQAIRTAILYTHSWYDTGDAIPHSFVSNYNSVLDGDIRGHSEWSAKLSDYGYMYADEFDAVIKNGVESGYFDVGTLKKAASLKTNALELEDKDNSFSVAWAAYHESFDDDGDQVLDNIAAAFGENYQAISPLNVAGTVRLFKELGREEQAAELIDFYVQNREEEADFWDLPNSPFYNEIQDEDIRAAFQTRYEELLPDPGSPFEILLKISRGNAYGNKDINVLLALGEDGFYDLFKSTKGPELKRLTSQSMRFLKISSPDSMERKIGSDADKALDRIAAESAMNGRRVKQHKTRN